MNEDGDSERGGAPSNVFEDKVHPLAIVGAGN